MNLLKKKFFSLLGIITTFLFLTVFSAPVFAWDDIYITDPSGSLINQADYSNQLPSFSDAEMASGLNVFYDGSVTTSITTPSPVTFDDNTLDVFSHHDFDQDKARPLTAAKFILTNQSGIYNATTVAPGSFSLTLNDNILQAAQDGTLHPGYDPDYNANHWLDLGNRLKGNVYGAFVQAVNSDIGTLSMTGNKVNSILDTGTDIFGAQTTLQIKNMEINLSLTDATLSANEVNIFNGTVTGNVAGASISGSINGMDSTLTLTPNITNNIVTITKGTFQGGKTIVGGTLSAQANSIFQAITLGGNITGNQLVINGGEYNNSLLIGGGASLNGEIGDTSSTLSSNISGNSITISNGDFYNSLIVGGMATSTNEIPIASNISNNVVEISGTTQFRDGFSWIAGAFTNNNSISPTNNKLVLKKPGVTVYGVDAFQIYDFDLSQATNGSFYLNATGGNGRDNDLFDRFNLGQANGPLDIDGVKITWTSYGRPTNLGLGATTTLLMSGNGFTGNMDTAGSDVSKDFTDGKFTYSYQLLQRDNSLDLILNKLVATNWTVGDGNIAFAALPTDDVNMEVTTTLAAENIYVASNSLAQGFLEAKTSLDVTNNDTNLTLIAGNYLIAGTYQETNKPKLGQVNASFNTINIDNGHNLYKTGTALYTFNTMNVLSDANISSLDVSDAGTHTVNLAANATIDTINIANGATLATSGSGTYTFNQLNTYGTGTFNQNLAAAGKNLNFFINENAAANSTVLTVNGNADITDSTVSVGILGNGTPVLQKDDQVVLVQATSLTGVPVRTTGVGNAGLLIKYQFDVETTANQLLATVTNTQLSENAKSFSEGRAVSTALVSQGTDFAAQDGMEAARQAAEMTEGLATFSSIGGGKSRYETGSHVDLTAFNALVGLTHEVEYWYNADWLLSSFIEYGTANYDTYNSFSSGDVKGKGNSQYIGLGILGKRISLKNTYFEISARIGQLKTDFEGSVYSLSDADYDYAVPYYGAHAGAGYVWQWSDSIALDMFGKYFWSHQDSKTVSIPSTGDQIHFKNTDSSRVRAGARFDFQLSEFWTPYLGGAYDYEFDGKARATTYGMDIDAPGLKGGTAIVEAGLTYNGDAITLGIGAEGYAGQRRGASGHVRLGFAF